MATPYEPYLRRYLNDDGRLWSPAQVERWALRAEHEICRVHPAVIIRDQLPILAGLPIYSVPPSHIFQIKSLGINQITYKGQIVQSLTMQQAHELFPMSVISDASTVMEGAFETAAFSTGAFFTFRAYPTNIGEIPDGIPQFWWYSGYREDLIQFYPNPSETIEYDSNATRFWDTDIPKHCVIEYRTVSYGAAAEQKPLHRLVRALIRDYVLSEAFAVEGKGQQIKEAAMLKKRFKARLDLYKALASNVFVANKHTMNNQSFQPASVMRRPNFGNDLGIRLR